MNIFRIFYFLFKSFVKKRIKLCFHNKICSVQLKTAWEVNYYIKTGVFFHLFVIINVPPIILDS